MGFAKRLEMGLGVKPNGGRPCERERMRENVLENYELCDEYMELCWRMKGPNIMS